MEVERGGRGLLKASDLQKATTTISFILIQGLCTKNLTKKILEERLEDTKEKNSLILTKKGGEVRGGKCDVLIKNLLDTCEEIGVRMKSYKKPNFLLEDIKCNRESFKIFRTKCKGEKIWRWTK